MEIISLQAAGQDCDDAHFSHLFLDHGVLADVEEDEEADEKKFILLPY